MEIECCIEYFAQKIELFLRKLKRYEINFIYVFDYEWI